jgi:chromosome segregation ATPase
MEFCHITQINGIIVELIKAKSQEVQQQLEQANVRLIGMEKAKHRQAQELEDAQLQAERATQIAVQLEKKQKGMDRLMEEWRAKCEALAAELEASQRETRMAGTEVGWEKWRRMVKN